MPLYICSVWVLIIFLFFPSWLPLESLGKRDEGRDLWWTRVTPSSANSAATKVEKRKTKKLDISLKYLCKGITEQLFKAKEKKIVTNYSIGMQHMANFVAWLTFLNNDWYARPLSGIAHPIFFNLFKREFLLKRENIQFAPKIDLK